MPARLNPLLFVTAGAVATLAPAARADAQTLSLEIVDGQVSLEANDVSIRAIFDRWAEVAPARILNADGLPDQRVTLRISDVDEETALATLLREAAGYMLVRRGENLLGRGWVDRIVILPRTAAPSSAASPRATFTQTDRIQPVVEVPATVPDSPSRATGRQAGQGADDVALDALPASPSATPAGSSGASGERSAAQPGAAAVAAGPRDAPAPLDPLGAPGVMSDGDMPQETSSSLNSRTADVTADPGSAATVPPNPFGIKTGTSVPTPGTSTTERR